MSHIITFRCVSYRSAAPYLTAAFCLAAMFTAYGVGYALAQDHPTPQNSVASQSIGIYLPVCSGATALSSVINAQANYATGMGDFLESASIARRNNALADEQEMRNTLQWVSTYFERRDLNRAYRLKNNPGYLENEAKRREILSRRITDLFQEVLKGDVTRETNWLLHELSGMALPYQYLPSDQEETDPAIDARLTKADLHKILLTDGGREGGRMLTFPADTARVLDTPWPRALRDPLFAKERKQFEDVRDKMLADRAAGKRNWQSEKKVMEACDALSKKYELAHPRKVRTQSYEAFAKYRSGRRYLKSLAAEVMRAITTQDEWIFKGVYRFEGDSVIDLVQHMCQNGLEFAPPRPGSEGAYRTLFENMRRIYLHLGANDPNRDLNEQ